MNLYSRSRINKQTIVVELTIEMRKRYGRSILVIRGTSSIVRFVFRQDVFREIVELVGKSETGSQWVSIKANNLDHQRNRWKIGHWELRRHDRQQCVYINVRQSHIDKLALRRFRLYCRVDQEISIDCFRKSLPIGQIRNAETETSKSIAVKIRLWNVRFAFPIVVTCIILFIS